MSERKNSRLRDLTGQRFGMLTALTLAGKDRTNKTLWRLQCDCGQQCVTTMLNVTKGNTKSCGCLRAQPARNRLPVGLRAGRLVTVRYDSARCKWECLCDCGATHYVASCKLTTETPHTRSCGCLAADLQIARSVNTDQNRLQRKRDRNATVRWARTVRSAFGLRCEACHSEDGRLHAHHVLPFAQYAELRAEPENGVALCVPCHRAAHELVRDGWREWDAVSAVILRAHADHPLAHVLRLLATSRYPDKGGVEDVKKARHYLDKLIECMEAIP